MELKDQSIGILLSRKDESAFEQVFKTHFKNLHSYAFTILKDQDEAEEIVQQVFFKLWERSNNLSLEGSVTSYLYRAVHNECMNFIKHQKVKADHRLHVVHSMKSEQQYEEDKLGGSELAEKIRESLNELPEQCRAVFQLSRFENLKYREIADKMDISVKTVENHMGKALRLLRAKLIDFLPLLLILFNY